MSCGIRDGSRPCRPCPGDLPGRSTASFMDHKRYRRSEPHGSTEPARKGRKPKHRELEALPVGNHPPGWVFSSARALSDGETEARGVTS